MFQNSLVVLTVLLFPQQQPHLVQVVPHVLNQHQPQVLQQLLPIDQVLQQLQHMTQVLQQLLPISPTQQQPQSFNLLTIYYYLYF